MPSTDAFGQVAPANFGQIPPADFSDNFDSKNKELNMEPNKLN
jgi:hypothetical protein